MINKRQITRCISLAVAEFWKSRKRAAQRQWQKGVRDTGSRGAVTGGYNMNGFVRLVENLANEAGLNNADVLVSEKNKTLPGFFRPTKDWDVIVTHAGQLIAVLEFKSQAGSFGKNFNNRAEEAIGSAEDFWLAFRGGSLGKIAKPFLGYCYLMEDCPESRRRVQPKRALYAIAPEFRNANRQKLLELLCRKLVRERKYDAAAAIFSPKNQGKRGIFREASQDVSAVALFSALRARFSAMAE